MIGTPLHRLVHRHTRQGRVNCNYPNRGRGEGLSVRVTVGFSYRLFDLLYAIKK